MIYTIDAIDTTDWNDHFVGYFLTYDECVKAIMECKSPYAGHCDAILIKMRKPGISLGTEPFWIYRWDKDKKQYCFEEEW